MKSKNYNPVFSKRLNDAIYESGLDVKELCEKSGIKRNSLWAYRFDGRNPTGSNIVKLCRVLNVSADWLLGLKERKE